MMIPVHSFTPRVPSLMGTPNRRLAPSVCTVALLLAHSLAAGCGASAESSTVTSPVTGLAPDASTPSRPDSAQADPAGEDLRDDAKTANDATSTTATTTNPRANPVPQRPAPGEQDPDASYDSQLPPSDTAPSDAASGGDTALGDGTAPLIPEQGENLEQLADAGSSENMNAETTPSGSRRDSSGEADSGALTGTLRWTEELCLGEPLPGDCSEESAPGDSCTPFPCDTNANPDSCDAVPGCSWEVVQVVNEGTDSGRSCKGEAEACDTYPVVCAEGCVRESDSRTCSGTPTPCESFTHEKQCSSQLGCHWE